MGLASWTMRSRLILRHLHPTTHRAATAAVSSSAAAAAAPLPDPHNVSHTLDAETSAAIVTRLEARGQDEIFRSLFLGYFPELRKCKNVLEIGCGTGVVLRALMQDPEFSGNVTGVDQSSVFLDAARRLAEEEGCPPDRVTFEVTAAGSGTPVSGAGGFDAVVMHTLISHTSDPAAVVSSPSLLTTHLPHPPDRAMLSALQLAEAAEMAAPGALLVVMDGDYGSLTYAHPEDLDLGRKMDQALVSSVFAQPNGASLTIIRRT